MNRKMMTILSYAFYFVIFCVILIVVFLIANNTDKNVNKPHGEEALTTTVLSTISVNRSNVSLKVGDTFKIVPSIVPNNGESFVYTSSDNSVVTVDENGLVTALSVGSAEIIVSVSGIEVSTNVLINVTSSQVEISNIFLDKTEVKGVIGGNYQINATVIPVNSSDKNLSYKSNDESIVTVDNNGLVTFLAIGESSVVVSSVSHPEVNTIIYFDVRKE